MMTNTKSTRTRTRIERAWIIDAVTEMDSMDLDRDDAAIEVGDLVDRILNDTEAMIGLRGGDGSNPYRGEHRSDRRQELDHIAARAIQRTFGDPTPEILPGESCAVCASNGLTVPAVADRRVAGAWAFVCEPHRIRIDGRTARRSGGAS